ncbi:hypothetical protein A2U01_0086439, partial [Trifolium medium]|nr:hypothetical protein [Trifolium medium]
ESSIVEEPLTHGINHTPAAPDPNATISAPHHHYTTASPPTTTTTPTRHQHPPNCHPP